MESKYDKTFLKLQVLHNKILNLSMVTQISRVSLVQTSFENQRQDGVRKQGFNAGEYGKTDKFIPANDNRKWALDVIAESLMSTMEGEEGQPAENAMVIFDESRHPQNAILADSYNTVYFLLVYFTGEGLAMLALFVVLFITFEAVLLKKRDPEPWRHVFSIIYYGFGDARRYDYYQRPQKIRQVLLTRVRNLNTMSREEFDALPAAELQRIVDDPVLVQFIFEDRRYKPDELVGIIKRIKAWGQTEESGA